VENDRKRALERKRILVEKDRKRALEQLWLFFKGLDSQKTGEISVVALIAALQHDEAMVALVHEAGVLDQFYLVRQLGNADTGSVTWEQILVYFDRAHEQEVVGNRALHQLKKMFSGVPKGRKGRVSTKRLVKALRCDTEEVMSLAEWLEQAGFCPYLAVLRNLDRQPGRVTWQEFVEKYVFCPTATPQELSPSSDFYRKASRSSDMTTFSHRSSLSLLQAESISASTQHSSLRLLQSESISDNEAVEVREWVEPRCWEGCFVSSPCGGAAVPPKPYLAI